MTQAERRNLQAYLDMRGNPVSAWTLFVRNGPYYRGVLRIFMMAGAGAYILGGSVGAGAVASAFCAVIAWEIHHNYRMARLWPLIEQVLDFTLIQDLLSSEQNTNSQ